MDPNAFGISTIPLQHEPYGPILPENLAGANEGKLAVVTGAGRGIGQAIAVALANSGAHLALLDLALESLEETKAACQKFKVIRVETFKCDVRDTQGVRDTFALIFTSLGPVDILVNNAGVFYGEMTSDGDFDKFWRAVEINFKGTMLCMYQVLPKMRERKSGCIVNISSRAATVDYPGGMSYSASKAAVARATATLQEEFEVEGLGDHLHTYSLHPGGVWGAMAAGAPPEVQKEMRPMFKDVPELCGNTVTFLATGRGRELRGLYLDCRQDVARLASFGRETFLKQNINKLSVKFLPGYENEP
ncbi:short-chain dehydrogenase-like protein 7 [Elsinoe australis]|uniref:Short-chain dehydrogenase-like protein 7 n=1 Tax=Elsinoe australis TaxID=40998 RepID=A0A4U7B4X3_9PEZI|nr:short-chain dehydrogenase-like protein 7 [Elsinoe australis]